MEGEIDNLCNIKKFQELTIEIEVDFFNNQLEYWIFQLAEI